MPSGPRSPIRGPGWTRCANPAAIVSGRSENVTAWRASRWRRAGSLSLCLRRSLRLAPRLAFP
jgi:hypothetical protein